MSLRQRLGDISQVQGFWMMVEMGFITFMLATSLGMEWLLAMEPCLLCQAQRLVLMVALVLALLRYASRRAVVWAYASWFLQVLVVSMGLMLSIRHVWLQAYPSLVKHQACLPDLTLLLQNHPVPQLMHLLMHGSSDCQRIDAQLWGISLPAWLSGCYAALIGLLVYDMKRLFCFFPRQLHDDEPV